MTEKEEASKNASVQKHFHAKIMAKVKVKGDLLNLTQDTVCTL